MKNTSFIPLYCLIIICGIFGLCSNLAFAAPPPYDAATCEATDVTSNSATLNGKVYNYFSESPMTAWFQYGTASGYYSSTSSTQTVSGTDITIVSIGISGLSPDTPYYYRIVAQNSELFLYGLEKSFTTLSAMATPTTIAVPTPSSASGCHSASGKVTDAVTKNGIENALVIGGMGISFTDAKGSYSWSDPEEILCCGCVYTLTASADGYVSQSQSIEIEPYIEGTLNFELQPISATPTVTPTPVCEAVFIEAVPKTLKLEREESDNITVTVTGSEGCPVAGERVTAKVKSGKKLISVTPSSQNTGISGNAVFTITSMKKTGNAKIKFGTASGLKTRVAVKVRK